MIDMQPDQSRRRLLQVGTAVVAGLATIMTRATPAHADCQGSPCCDLASCTRCSERLCGGWYCPGGYQATYWTCVAPGSGRHVLCGECSGGSSCYSGPWACSIWFYTG